MLLASFTAGCHAEQHFFDVTGELFVLSAATHYQEALERAQQWRPDARLDRVSATPGSSRPVGPGPSLTFMFHSDRGDDDLYVVRWFQGSWSARAVPQDAISVTQPPILREDWPLDSVDAWATAQANGGQDFLVKGQDPLTLIVVILSHERVGGRENVLVWRVLYSSGSATIYEALDMMIDPKTGDILELSTD